MYDFLILGQGLAGSLLAWQLVVAGARVLVIDDGHRSASSRVAAGLINPLAGMRFNAAAETAEWLASMRTTYDAIATTLSAPPYVHEIPMQRLLRSPEQHRFWERQQANPAALPYLGHALAPEAFDPGIRAPYGGFEQRATGYVDLPRLLDGLRDWLNAMQALEQREIHYQDIVIGSDAISLGAHRARHLVCCEGYRMQQNPWFADLPLQPDKGELLRLESERVLCRHIVNGAHWLIPLHQGNYRFGSTHEHHHIDNRTTGAALKSLQQGLQALLVDDTGIRISEHTAGVRPATSDRQPFLGTHAKVRRLHLFNGFGARGALTIPWYSIRMREYLLTQRPLPLQADIGRFA